MPIKNPVKEYSDDEILRLLGREPVYRDLKEVRSFYRGKTIVVTGGAGSIGTELVKLVITLGVKRVVVFDRWENGIFHLQQSLNSPLVTYIIGDVKTKKIDKILHQYRPEIIIHASAYKHVPLMQDNPIEAFNNNVWGAINTMESAIRNDCENFVLVSTDKAVNPTNVMGATKRICEIIMQNVNGNTKFNVVRFGNVIQSNGSVVPTFLRQIEQGQDLTVTHKNITRYFMTKREASELILLSSTIAKSGEIFLLDMGDPIKIYDLAQRLVEDNNSDSRIVITGLRKGEKMFEELSYNTKTMDKTTEEKIFIVRTPMEQNLEKAVRSKLSQSLNYEITDSEMISFLIKLGFYIKR